MSMYRDRRDGGRALAGALSKYKGELRLLVLASPRGGVPSASSQGGLIHANSIGR
jgi:predicted phosphoribosyltransferase